MIKSELLKKKKTKNSYKNSVRRYTITSSAQPLQPKYQPKQQQQEQQQQQQQNTKLSPKTATATNYNSLAYP